MVSLVLIVIIIVLAASLARLAMRPPQPRLGWSTLWRLACLISAVRVGALWIGNIAYRNAGWPQSLGYLLQLIGLPEIYLARGARADTTRWLLLASSLLAASSLGWAALLVWVGNRVRRLSKPTSSVRGSEVRGLSTAPPCDEPRALNKGTRKIARGAGDQTTDIRIAEVSQDQVEPFLRREWAAVDVGRASATPLQAWRRQEYCLAAYDGDEIVGAAVYRVLGGVAHLENLIVAHGWRRRGLGGALVEEFIERAGALGCHKLTLRAADTDELVRFYRRHGFEIEARFPDDVFHADRCQMVRFLRRS